MSSAEKKHPKNVLVYGTLIIIKITNISWKSTSSAWISKKNAKHYPRNNSREALKRTQCTGLKEMKKEITRKVEMTVG
jgi:hypothetical protein